MKLVRRVGYRLRLSASVYPRLRWYAVPMPRTGQVSLVILGTFVPPGRHGPSGDRLRDARRQHDE